jgi:uncharacterized protein (DUF433 family)
MHRVRVHGKSGALFRGWRGRRGESIEYQKAPGQGRTAMKWQDRIAVNPKILVGKPVIKGTRIAVEFVVDLLGRGWTADRILKEYDHLAPEDIQACLAYASDVLKSERVYPAPGNE